jgi:hypothetical protein
MPNAWESLNAIIWAGRRFSNHGVDQAFRAGCSRSEYNTEEIFRERGGAGIYAGVNGSIKLRLQPLR